MLTVIYKNTTTNDTCCKNRDTVTVTVTASCCRIGSSLQDKPQNDKVKVYPVPSKQFVTIEPGFEMTDGEIAFFDVSSRQVWKKEKIKGAGQIMADLKELPRGIYFVTISESGKLIHTQKVVLQE